MHKPLHALHAVLLAGTVPLFLGVLLSDLAYASTFEIQWKNFASWLLAGGLIFSGFALLWAAIDTFRPATRTTWQIIYFSTLLMLWVLGFINALLHAADAWASMPTARVISMILALLAIAATWLGFAHFHRRVRS